MPCPYKDCHLGCSNKTKHKALYALMNTPISTENNLIKVSIKKSSKINYEALRKLQTVKN